MNWDAISAVGEIIGAVAVVVSLIYVAAQIRQNTQMARSTAKQSLTEATHGVIYKAMDYSTEWVKLMTGEEPSSQEEDARMSLLARACLRGFETQCYQYESGLLEEQEWKALRAAICTITAWPGFNRYWQQLTPMMSERLRRVIEEE
jgi:hypothetical protein